MPYKDIKIRREKSKERWEKWASNNPDKVYDTMVNWRDTNRAYWICYQAKNRDKREGMDFDLDWKELIIPEICPVLGIPLYPSPKGGPGVCPNSPTLDRKDNSKGYTKDNVCIISWQANKWKSDMSISDVENLLRYMKEK